MVRNDPDILHPAAMKGITVAGDIGVSANSMVATLQGLEGQWKGPAGREIQLAAQVVQADLNKINAEVAAISQILVRIATNTAETDSDAQTTVATVQAAASGLADRLRGN